MEEDLILRYLNHRLDQKTREQFEKVYLADPALLEEVHIHRAFKDYDSDEPPMGRKNRFSIFPSHSRSLLIGLATILLAIPCVLILLFWNSNLQLRREAQSLRDRLQIESSKLKKLRSESTVVPDSRGLMRMRLKSDLTRGSGHLDRLSMPSGTGIVLLELEIPEQHYKRYRASLLTRNSLLISKLLWIWKWAGRATLARAGTARQSEQSPLGKTKQGVFLFCAGQSCIAVSKKGVPIFCV